jgi:hypothetical protein
MPPNSFDKGRLTEKVDQHEHRLNEAERRDSLPRSNSFDKGKLTESVRQHEQRLNEIDMILEKVRNRPPLWCIFVLGGLLAALGWFIRAMY